MQVSDYCSLSRSYTLLFIRSCTSVDELYKTQYRIMQICFQESRHILKRIVIFSTSPSSHGVASAPIHSSQTILITILSLLFWVFEDYASLAMCISLVILCILILELIITQKHTSHRYSELPFSVCIGTVTIFVVVLALYSSIWNYTMTEVKVQTVSFN
jgi:lysylphosphatidylglycerol synthetase-like protein (DUF2156 family)